MPHPAANKRPSEGEPLRSSPEGLSLSYFSASAFIAAAMISAF